MATRPICVVIGVGPGNGAAFARRFAADGYAVALVARTATTSRELAATLPDARAYECDVGDAASVQRTFDAIRSELGEAEVVIYNASSRAFGSFDEISTETFDEAWRTNTLGAFLVAKQVVPGMKKLGRGSFVFIGATASRRGGAQTVAFAPAKAAQRSLAESLAKHLWPAGIHVSLIVIDGVVDLERTRTQMPGKPDEFFVKPDDVAATAAWLTGQPRSAWAFEVEARPFGERW